MSSAVELNGRTLYFTRGWHIEQYCYCMVASTVFEEKSSAKIEEGEGEGNAAPCMLWGLAPEMSNISIISRLYSLVASSPCN